MALSAGTRLGPYEILSVLGAGGMGEVYKARDTRLERIVAIKILKGQHSERFAHEARAIAALNHPHICTLHDIGHGEGVDFLVMECLEGESLASRLHKGPLAVEQATRYAIEIADGLSAAHRKGIIHRDLKPSNILITKSGVKLLDFGLAKVARATAADQATLTMTAENVVAGTPQYMAPEQIEGKEADARSDIFAFGATLYEMLAGRKAFAGESTASVIAAVVEHEPAPITAPGAEPLDRIVRTCLAKDPDERFQTARDLKRSLEWRRVVEAPTKQRPARGRRTALVAGLLAAGMLAGFTLDRLLVRIEPRPLAPIPLTSSGGLSMHPSFSPDGRQVVFSWARSNDGNFDLYLKLIGSEDTLRLTNDPAPDLAPAWSPDGSRIAFLRDLGNGRLAVMTISPLGGSEHKIAEAQSMPNTLFEQSLSWTPDGKYLAMTDNAVSSAVFGYGLYLISSAGSQKIPLTQVTPREIKLGVYGDMAAAFSPAGDRLAFVRVTAGLQSKVMWIPLGPDYRAAGQPRELETGFTCITSVAWTREGKDLLVTAGETPSDVRILRVPYARRSPPAAVLPGVAAMRVALHPATGRLIYESPFYSRNLWELPFQQDGKTGGEPVRLTYTDHMDYTPHYSPDGKWIVFGSNRSGSPEVWMMSRDGSRTARLASMGNASTWLGDWSSDGKSVYFFSNPKKQYEIFAADVETGAIRQLTDNPGGDSSPTCSRDGRWIYYSSVRDGQVQLYKMPAIGGSATPVLQQARDQVQESRDGRWLYYANDLQGGPLYRMPAAGGAEVKLVDSVQTPYAFAVTRHGIYYVPGTNGTELHLLDPDTHRDTIVSRMRNFFTGISLSPDERFLCYVQQERESRELMLIEGFH